MKCKYCQECIYCEKCSVNAPYRMECKSMYQLMCGFSACCEDFVIRKSIYDIYEEQKAEQPDDGSNRGQACS